jgi:hypothetical protein
MTRSRNAVGSIRPPRARSIIRVAIISRPFSLPLIFWNQITGSELLIVAEGRCRSPSPDAALVKAPLRIAAPLFVEAASSAFQGTDIRAFRLRGGTRATPVSALKPRRRQILATLAIADQDPNTVARHTGQG